MGRTNTAIRIVPQDNEARVREYRRICKEIQELEDMKKVLNGELTELARTAGGSLVVGAFCLKVSNCTKETINVKNAVQGLGSKVLAPFISTSQYTMLRITVLDDEEQETSKEGN